MEKPIVAQKGYVSGCPGQPCSYKCDFFKKKKCILNEGQKISHRQHDKAYFIDDGTTLHEFKKSTRKEK